jgi:hypothetical protein
MKVITILVAGVVSLLAGCSSPDRAPQAQSERQLRNVVGFQSAPAETKRKMAEFVDITAAVYRRQGQDIKKEGYKLVFTDVGPESMERDAPEVFAVLLQNGSGGGVTFRGFSPAVVDKTSVRDKATGEKGVGFMLAGLQEDGKGGWKATGDWYEKEGAWRQVNYHVTREGGRWKAR